MDERHKAIDTVIKNMEKSFGKGAVMKLGDDAGRKVQTTSSGSVTLDRALGVGGYPKVVLLKFTDQSLQVKQQYPYTPLQKCKKTVASVPLSTQNTR